MSAIELVISCRGVSEQYGNNTLSPVTIPGADHIDALIQPQVGPAGTAGVAGPAYQVACAQGVSVVLDLIAARRVPTLVVGYSFGAAVAHLVAARRPTHLRAVGMLGSPLHPAWPGAKKYGILSDGPGIPSGILAKWWTDPRDPISQLEYGSPLRTVSDQLVAFGLGDPALWTLDLADRLKRQRWQPTNLDWLRNPVAAFLMYQRAAEDVRGYLGPPLGYAHHSSYSVRQAPGRRPGVTYIDDMTDWACSL